MTTADKGAHYRFQYRGINLDPYRICAVYGITGGPREHMLKKILRCTDKGHTTLEVLDELQCVLDRWREMAIEDTPLPFVPTSEPATLYDWSKIPDGFNWCAVDSNGHVHAFTKKPRLASIGFFVCNGDCVKVPASLLLAGAPKPWRESLEQRPQVTAD